MLSLQATRENPRSRGSGRSASECREPSNSDRRFPSRVLNGARTLLVLIAVHFIPDRAIPDVPVVAAEAEADRVFAIRGPRTLHGYNNSTCFRGDGPASPSGASSHPTRVTFSSGFHRLTSSPSHATLCVKRVSTCSDLWRGRDCQNCGLGVLRTFQWKGGASNSRRLEGIKKQKREKAYYI